MKIEEMTLEQLLNQRKVFEKAKLKARRKQEFLGIMICDSRLERINQAIYQAQKNMEG